MSALQLVDEYLRSSVLYKTCCSFSISGSVRGSSAGVSVSETFPTFSPADVDMNMDSRSIDLSDNMGVGSMDENNSNISGPASNISPRGQDSIGFVGESDITTRTSFSVDVPPFKSQLENVNTFSQSEMGKVFNNSDSQGYSTAREMDGFSVGSDIGPNYSQGFSSAESVHSFSQGFSSGSGTVLTYSQPFPASSETYTGNSEVGSFAQTNLANMMDLKTSATEKSNICTVSVKYLHCSHHFKHKITFTSSHDQ